MKPLQFLPVPVILHLRESAPADAPFTVDGLVCIACPSLAVTPRLDHIGNIDPERFVITHVPTGMRLTSGSSQKDACARVLRLAALPSPWEESDRDKCQALDTPAVREILDG